MRRRENQRKGGDLEENPQLQEGGGGGGGGGGGEKGGGGGLLSSVSGSTFVEPLFFLNLVLVVSLELALDIFGIKFIQWWEKTPSLP